MGLSIDGSVLWRGESGYEQARQNAVWNARKPDRYPDLIVRAATEQDVLTAVRYAREQGLKVKARSGGHSWQATSVREGGMLVDLSQLTEVTVDPGSHTASVQPGGRGRELNNLLEPHGLMFPTGHCPSVGIGGFLLQGGWGWNSRALGPACMSVTAVEVVTAEGELIRAEETQNSDYLWAARGAGPGFFGIVTRFEIQAHPRPAAMLGSGYVYPLEVLDEVLRWAIELAPSLPPALEFVILGTTPRRGDGTLGTGGTSLVVSGAAMMDSEAQARAALALLESCPVLDRALGSETYMRRDLNQLYDAASFTEPEGYRWAVDNMWTDAGADELVPAARELFETVPNPISHVFWYPWHEQPLGDAALSITGRHYIAAFAGWTEEADDDRYTRWPVDHMRRLEPLSKGIQLADENLVSRPSPYLSRENEERLEALRARHDPEGVFHSYLTA